MKLGMIKEEILALMGEPDYNKTFGDMAFMDWYVGSVWGAY